MVPSEFQPRMPFPYPKDNHTEFEWWYMTHSERQIGGRIYLPIMWTAYYVKHGIDKNMRDNHHADTNVAHRYRRLELFLFDLRKDVKYYTIVQHDDGILHDLSHLDITVFSMGGGIYDHALPLVACPHEWSFPGVGKTILASFVGQITHPIRQRIIDKYGLRNGDIMLSIQKMQLKDYCQILAMSKYVLCPRGYGPTSFRIQEALQYGAIPVYISDDIVEPMGIDFNRYGIKIKESDLDDFSLTNLPWDSPIYFEEDSGAPISEFDHADIFTYEACKRYIENNI